MDATRYAWTIDPTDDSSHSRILRKDQVEFVWASLKGGLEPPGEQPATTPPVTNASSASPWRSKTR